MQMIYEDPSRSPALLASYGVDYLVVGDSENERYSVLLPENVAEEIFSQNGTKIFRVLALSA